MGAVPIARRHGEPLLDEREQPTFEWWFCGVVPYVMNQGTRPASKIACRFSEIFQEEWRTVMRRDVVPEWLKQQTPELVEALRLRKQHLGPHDADPFLAYLYTDDFAKWFVGPRLAALGTQAWRRILNDANVWVSAKVGFGTVIHSHGGRFVLNAGYTCLTPNKLARGIDTACTALSAGITRDELEANNSFLVHVHDIANLRPGTLKGVWAPLKVPGVGTDSVRLTESDWPRPRECYASVVEQLRTRASASFHCAVADAHLVDPMTGAAATFSTASSDACTDPAHGLPQVVGWLDGCYWNFELTGEWLCRHITVTEALGLAGNALIFGPRAPADNVMLEGDATAGLAMILGTTDSEDLQYMHRRLERTKTWASVAPSLWAIHSAGVGNVFADLGSRNKWDELTRLAAALGIKLRRVDTTREFLLYASDVLANTTHFEHAEVERQREFARRRQQQPALPRIKYRFGVEAIEYMDSPRRTPSGAKTPPMFDSPVHIGRDEARQPCRTPPITTPVAASRQRNASPPPGPRVRTPDILPPQRGGRSAAASPSTLDPPCARDAANDVDEQWRRRRDQTPTRHAPRCGSPQPVTAASARRAAALSAADSMVEDDTPYALCPNDPDRLRSLCVNAAAARQDAIPTGTKKADEWGFAWAMRFGKAHNTPWLRPRVVPEQYVEREASVLALMLMWWSVNMAASAKRAARGFTQAMPDSPMNAMYGYRRVLRDCGRYLAPLHLALAQLRALRQQYVATWGNMSLVPAKHTPFSETHIAQLLCGLAKCVVKAWSAVKHGAWTVLVLYELVTGTRNDEVAGVDTRLQRDSFTPVIGGVCVEPTTENWQRLTDGDYINGKSAPSKCDRTNAHWGSKDMWFKLDSSNPRNFAHAWKLWELQHPCEVSRRGSAPAFSPSADEAPFTTRGVHADIKALLTHACDVSAHEHTFHDFRATLATRLLQDGEADAVIQALLRWKTPESIRTYAEMSPSQYADRVERATLVRAPMQAPYRDIPEIEPSSACSRIDATLERLQHAVQPSKGGGETTAAPTKETAIGSGEAARPPTPRTTPTTTQRRKARVTSVTPPPPSSVRYDLGELGIVEGIDDPTRTATGRSVKLPLCLWPGATATGFCDCTVVAWAPSISKYIIISHDDNYHYAIPAKEILKRQRKV